MGKVKFQRATKSSRELRRMAQREQSREQRQKAISKAGAEQLLRLGRVLCCPVEELV